MPEWDTHNVLAPEVRFNPFAFWLPTQSLTKAKPTSVRLGKLDGPVELCFDKLSPFSENKRRKWKNENMSF